MRRGGKHARESPKPSARNYPQGNRHNDPVGSPPSATANILLPFFFFFSLQPHSLEKAMESAR